MYELLRGIFMAKVLNTKEKIASTSLNLFSKKGFDGVSVRDIATAVGIKESSVYNHFSSKKNILDSIIDEQSERCEKITKNIFSEVLQNDFTKVSAYDDVASKLFMQLFRDKYTAKFWNILNTERIKNKKCSEKISKIFFDDILSYIMTLFYQLINRGIMKNQSPAVLALEFYSSLYIIFQRYYVSPVESSDEIEPLTESMIKEHITQFCKNNLI